MIDVRELRIGNLILKHVINLNDLDKSDDQIFTVNARELYDGENYKQNWNAKPIPITTEWLERMGFEKNLTPHYIEWKFINDIFYSYMVGTELRWFSKTLPNIDKITYVHQLQNLYFTLTGIELEIKPKL